MCATRVLLIKTIAKGTKMYFFSRQALTLAYFVLSTFHMLISIHVSCSNKGSDLFDVFDSAHGQLMLFMMLAKVVTLFTLVLFLLKLLLKLCEF